MIRVISGKGAYIAWIADFVIGLGLFDLGDVSGDERSCFLHEPSVTTTAFSNDEKDVGDYGGDSFDVTLQGILERCSLILCMDVILEPDQSPISLRP